MRYHYTICSADDCKILCFRCANNFPSYFKSIKNHDHNHAYWYKTRSGSIYCYSCINKLENEDPRFALGLEAT